MTGAFVITWCVYIYICKETSPRKGKVWIRTLVTQHEELNSILGLNRKKILVWKVKSLDVENGYSCD